jgi:hypothetical protein
MVNWPLGPCRMVGLSGPAALRDSASGQNRASGGRGATGGDGLGGVYVAAEATLSLTRSLRASVPHASATPPRASSFRQFAAV